ncbi:Hsp33 family molecular chaperone [Cohaesibacter celericrescens]|uniref:Hsp33 family molecular chaperone n=1 Tax=Cohaesibacter celericrescens TaxID=2067669 RepID=A0A2N5XN56_9HYPH|nr:Hsp33 family molecular chaperone [Cohaesibacter celericrescens]PLW75860.1 Hsp33 family molecular chaperone [Cohaesibacter celericrescens]
MSKQSDTTAATITPISHMDRVLPFQVDGLDVRGRMVHLNNTVTGIIQRHDYPDAVNRLLAEAIALTSLLGSSLKFEGKFILQVQSKGAVNMLAVDFTAPDAVRAYVRFDDEALAALIEKGETLPEQLLGEGTLIMTIDQGQYMNRYQGIVILDGKSLEEAAHSYFMQSEQLPTRVRLAATEMVTKQKDGSFKSEWLAGGLLVQYLPHSSTDIPHRDLHPGDHPDLDSETGGEVDEVDVWRECEALINTVNDHELTDPAVTAETLLYRLFHENNPRVFDEMPIEDRCTCSREKIGEVLNNFKPEDRDDMMVDGKIEVTCEFCSTSYNFVPEEIEGEIQGRDQD